MSLFDQAREAAFGLAKAKLSSGVGGDILNRVEPLLRRAATVGGNSSFTPKGVPGARDPLSAGRARLDPLMSYNWYCDLPVIDGVKLSWENVEEATLPSIELDAVSNYRAGKMWHYPHHHSIGTLSLKLYEDSKGSSSLYVDKWRRNILDYDSGLYHLPKDYKKTIMVTVLDVANVSVMFFEYTGCWPMRSDPITMNSGSSDRIVPQIEFSVDEMRVKFGKFDSSKIPSIINNVGVDFPPQISKLPDLFPNNFVNIAFGAAGDILNGVSNSLQSKITDIIS